LFPQVGRLQQTEGVRNFVTRCIAYLSYYIVDSTAAEIVVLGAKHPAQRREHDDASASQGVAAPSPPIAGAPECAAKNRSSHHENRMSRSAAAASS
jgi:hypothetical protein